MQKPIKLILLNFILICSVMLFFGCNNVLYRVDFIVDGGIYYIVDTYGNEEIEIPENPIKEDYNFIGWYYDNNTFENEFNKNSLLTIKLNRNIRVYAKFIHKPCSVTLNNNNGENATTLSVDFNSKLNLGEQYNPLAPFEYLEFDKWCTDILLEDEFDFNTDITTDVNLYAKWKMKEGYLPFVVLSGSMGADGFSTKDVVLVKDTDTDSLRARENETGDIVAFYYYNTGNDATPTDKTLITDFDNLPYQDSDTINYNGRVTMEDIYNSNARIYFHRIVNVYMDEEGIRYFQTKGSSNSSSDAYLIREDMIIGKYFAKNNNIEQYIGNYFSDALKIDSTVTFEPKR